MGGRALAALAGVFSIALPCGLPVGAHARPSERAGDHRDIERKGRRNHTDFDARQQADSTNQSETDDER